MEDIAAAISAGTLHQLDALHNQSKRLTDLQDANESSRKDIESLRNTLNKLKRRRNALEVKAGQCKRRKALSGVAEAGGHLGDGGVDAHTREKALKSATKIAKKHANSELCAVYELCGRELVAIPEHDDWIGVKFLTASDGLYDANFFAALEPGDGDEESYSVVRHTLPPFIPIQQLEASHLQSGRADLPRFVREVECYLDARAARRAEMDRLTQHMSDRASSAAQVAVSLDKMSCQGGDAFARLELRVTVAAGQQWQSASQRRYKAVLCFEDLCSTVATSAKVLMKPTGRKAWCRLPAREAPFLRGRLYAAFSEAFADPSERGDGAPDQ